MPAASSGGGATGGGKGEGGARVARGPPVSPAGGDAGASPLLQLLSAPVLWQVSPQYNGNARVRVPHSASIPSFLYLRLNFQNVRGIYTVAQHDADAPI
jgi:hypothetical protein